MEFTQSSASSAAIFCRRHYPSTSVPVTVARGPHLHANNFAIVMHHLRSHWVVNALKDTCNSIQDVGAQHMLVCTDCNPEALQDLLQRFTALSSQLPGPKAWTEGDTFRNESASRSLWSMRISQCRASRSYTRLVNTHKKCNHTESC